MQLIITCIIDLKYSFIDEIDDDRKTEGATEVGKLLSRFSILTSGCSKAACSFDSPILDVFCARVSMKMTSQVILPKNL